MKVVISVSAKLQNEIKKWITYWNQKDNHVVLGYPKFIPENNFDSLYKDTHIQFLKNITEADILFVANENKNGVSGYVGPATFAELEFGLAQKLIYHKKIKLILANWPSKEVACYEEIVLWKKFGWIDEILN